MKEIIEELKKEYNRQIDRDATEEDIKIYIIREIFLEKMGYDTRECRHEKNTISGRQDIVVGVGKNVLTIETKREKIEYKDIEQVIRYILNEGRTWGLITNGKEYVLINTDIKTRTSTSSKALLDKVVFWFDILKNKGINVTNHKYFRYLTFEFLFITKVTSYYMYIQQFRVFNKVSDSKNSWEPYKSTLYSFFDYLTDKNIRFVNKTTLEQISIIDFDLFIKNKTHKSNKEALSKQTINNNWSHISSMMKTLKSHGEISHTAFDAPRNPDFGDARNGLIKYENYLTTENVRKIIKLYSRKHEKERNIAAFILCALYGFERSDVNGLKWNQINLNNNKITINGRILIVNPLLVSCLQSLDEERKKGKNKLDYVFCTKPREKFEPFKEATLNDIFNKIVECGDEEYWHMFSPKYVKNCSIRVYFDLGYSLDEIVYLTGVELKNLESYITTADVIARFNSGVAKKNNIFEGILNSNIKDW
jgi:integrase